MCTACSRASTWSAPPILRQVAWLAGADPHADDAEVFAFADVCNPDIVIWDTPPGGRRLREARRAGERKRLNSAAAMDSCLLIASQHYDSAERHRDQLIAG